MKRKNSDTGKKHTASGTSKKQADRKTNDELYTATEMKFLRRVGRKVAGLRVMRDLTQDQLATAAKISRSYLGYIEVGARNMHALALLKIATALKVPVSELLQVEDF